MAIKLNRQKQEAANFHQSVLELFWSLPINKDDTQKHSIPNKKQSGRRGLITAL